MSLSLGLVPLMVVFAAVVVIVWIAHIAGKCDKAALAATRADAVRAGRIVRAFRRTYAD